MKTYQVKNIDKGALDMDVTARKVKVAIASVGNLDRDNDVIVPGAFTKTIMERGPSGTNEIWHLLDHHASLKSALSKFEELYVEGDYLVGVSEYKDTFAWREVAWPLYESFSITQHSIGFTILESAPMVRDGKTYNEIRQVQLWEGSAVLWGANPNTPTMEVIYELSEKAGITKQSDDLPVRIERICKALKRDELDNDVKSLLLIELKQLQSDLAAITSTLPGNTTGPQKKAGLDWSAILKQI